MIPSISDLKNYADTYSLVPVWKKVGTDIQSPVEFLRRLKQHSRKLFVLEHTENNNGQVVWDRYAYIGYAPSLEIYCIDKTVTLEAGQSKISFHSDAPIEYLRGIIAQNKAPRLPGLPPFFGGFAGYFSYEYIALAQPTCHFCTENKEHYRDFDLMLFDKLFVLDRQEGELYLICNIATDHLEENYAAAQYALDEMERAAMTPAPSGTDAPLRLLGEMEPIYPKDAYMEKVAKAKDYIQKGVVAQIVLTNGRRMKADGSLLGTHELIRKMDPTRYMCYFSTDDVEATMTSPEPIINLKNGVVMTERLAGSYARGKTPEEDAAQAAALQSDAKAIDEHNMLVDDSRNEFGFVSKIGTVKVSNYLNVVRCSRVMHLGSTITGELKPEMNVLDVINTIMPSGAVSGAPKIRSCEVINEIEQERRGVYGSAVGFIGVDGDADFFAFIHSAFLKDGELVVRAGGGIVIDSVPEDEYEECLFKAEAMLATIKLAAKEEKDDPCH